MPVGLGDFQAGLDSIQRPETALDVILDFGEAFADIVKKEREIEQRRVLHLRKNLREFRLPAQKRRWAGE